MLALLNATLARQIDEQEMQNNVLTKQLDHMLEKDSSTKIRVKNLHEFTINMLLFTSAMNNETVPIDLSESCKYFINSKTVEFAEQELTLQFENCGMTKVRFRQDTQQTCTSVPCFGPAATPQAITPRSRTPAYGGAQELLSKIYGNLVLL